MAPTNSFLPSQWDLQPIATRQRGGAAAYLDVYVCHEHGEVGEVRAGAGGVRPIGAQQTAVLRGPVARHGFLGVAPERAIGVEVLLRVLQDKGKTRAVRRRLAEQKD